MSRLPVIDAPNLKPITQPGPGLTEIEEVVWHGRRLAAEQPDFIYQKVGKYCKYEPDDKNPNGCIVGAAMRAIGRSVDGRLRGAVSVVGHELDIEGDRRLWWLAHAQVAQDAGSTWAESVRCADQEMTRWEI